MCCRGGCRTRWTGSFCVEALEAALQTGTPGIFNTDQGSQFTSAAFTDRVQAAGARCSMDGRGRCLDNVFIERLWRSLKYEAVYLHGIRLAGDSSTNTGRNSRNGLGTLEVPNGNGAVNCIGSIGASPLRVTIPAWVGRS